MIKTFEKESNDESDFEMESDDEFDFEMADDPIVLDNADVVMAPESKSDGEDFIGIV